MVRKKKKKKKAKHLRWSKQCTKVKTKKNKNKNKKQKQKNSCCANILDAQTKIKTKHCCSTKLQVVHTYNLKIYVRFYNEHNILS